MGLFSFFNSRNRSQQNGTSVDALPPIPEKVFIEKDETDTETRNEKNGSTAEFGINLLFQFLDKNYEGKGYDDALVNPDSAHLEQNLSSIQNDLEKVIRRVKTFYDDFIREINFHIASRSRSGMIDTVEELTMKKEKAESHIKQVLEIEDQAKANEGVGQGILLSYTRGFKNGLAAISHHNILRKEF